MLSPYRIPNIHTRNQKPSYHGHKLTSNDLKMTSKKVKMTSKDENDKPVSEKRKTKNNSRGGGPKDNPSNGRDLIERAFSSQ